MKDEKYLSLLSSEYPTVSSAAAEIIGINARRSLPKTTEYFFSDLHGEHESFLYQLRSASGTIKFKIDDIFSKSVSASERESLADLIYYPEDYIKNLSRADRLDDEWRKITIYRMILVCKTVSAKYTRAEVRSKMPESFGYVLDELLNVTDDINRDFYYEEIIRTVIETGIADDFIIEMASLIRALTVGRLHIIGDVFDRGPRADKIMNELSSFKHIDFQWGNHDVSWMGAASGNTALIANVIRIALSYNSLDVLEDGYGLNLRPLSVFAAETYADDRCGLFMPKTLDDVKFDFIDSSLTAKMHKAIAVIQLKLECDMIRRHPEYGMDDRAIFEKIDFKSGTLTLGQKTYKLLDNNFPTVDPADPAKLTEKEAELMRVLLSSFHHSRLLNEHIRFLYSHGSMYKLCNGNVLYHGCIPMNDDGTFRYGKTPEGEFFGRELLDRTERIIRRAYFSKYGSDEQREACDYMWYLWCGKDSPLFGKDKLAFAERTFLEKNIPESVENYDPYYTVSHSEDTCRLILSEFGLDPERGHIINGHVPVHHSEGESPVKAGGRLFVIDGGISKAYRSKTGIAGYTLIFDSHSLQLAEHRPAENGIFKTPKIRVVEKLERRFNVSDTDNGAELYEKSRDLSRLIEAYRSGEVPEKA
ncbi:MAG: fructose-1,6-bisphosphatase [Clostridiales bacterium]|nr:fructose-1,6-bisphosphatase [Clostridiales bacterium]